LPEARPHLRGGEPPREIHRAASFDGKFLADLNSAVKEGLEVEGFQCLKVRGVLIGKDAATDTLLDLLKVVHLPLSEAGTPEWGSIF